MRNSVTIAWFGLLALGMVYFHHPFPGSGVTSRMDLTFAICDQKTIAIDAYHENTHDKAYVNGHYYTVSGPLLSMLGTPVYCLVRLIPGVEPGSRMAGYLLTMGLVTLSALFLVLWLRRFLETFAEGGPLLLVLTAYALGTVALPYASLYFHHQVAALFCFGSFALVWKRIHTKDAGRNFTLLAGALAGLSVCMEYPTGLIAMLLGGYLLVGCRSVREAALFFLPVILFPVVILGSYNHAAFGSVFSLGYGNILIDTYQQEMQKGLMGVTVPRLSSLWLILFSPSRGLFFWSPVLLLALPGLAKMIREPKWRLEGILICAVAAGHLLFNSAYHQPSGGECFGPRHLVVIVPFLIVPLYAFLQDARRSWIIAAAVFTTLSMAMVGAATALEPNFSEHIENPLVEFLPVWASSGGRLDNLPSLLGMTGGTTILPYFIFAGVVLGLAALKTFGSHRLPQNVDRSVSGWRKYLPTIVVCLVLAGYAISIQTMRTSPGVLHQAMGNHFMVHQKYSEAESAYRQAIIYRPDPYLRYYLGMACLKTNDRACALAAYKEVLRLDPDFAEGEKVRKLIKVLEY